MDTRRERLFASLLGAGGSVVGLILYQAIPELIRRPELKIRPANATAFLATVFLTGLAGGRLGHWFFLQLRVGLTYRALLVGIVTGAAIAAVGWTVAFLFNSLLFPFEKYQGYEDLMKSWLLPALIAGPIGGVLVSLAIVRRLRRITGEREPLEDASLQ